MSGEDTLEEMGEKTRPEVQLVLYQEEGKITVTVSIYREVRLYRRTEEEEIKRLRL